MNNRFLTWLDIQREIKRKTYYGQSLPESIIRIDCFFDAIEIGIESETKQEDAKQVLKEWFSDWYEAENSVIRLDIDDKPILVEFSIEEKARITRKIRPFWQEITYLRSDRETHLLPDFPEVDIPEYLDIIAFYSFKGGVGRSLSLVAHVLALLNEVKEQEKSVNILVIDADLEAPGITYWQKSESLVSSISFLDFLEVYHSTSSDIDTALDFVAHEIKKTVRNEVGSNLYVLPTCLDERELLDTPILPEHLLQNINGTWEFTTALVELGKKLELDYIFIDLRSGLSEISSPLMFDPRIQKNLVGTLNEQSISGTRLVLEHIKAVQPHNTQELPYEYFEPIVLLNFLTPALREISDYENHLESLQQSYRFQTENPENSGDYDSYLVIKEADFAQQLLYLNSWSDAKRYLPGTQLMHIAEDWAKEHFINVEKSSKKELISQDSEEPLLDQVLRLRELCGKYEYAENGESEDLLITEPLQNLARNFQSSLPHIVSIGSKGSGKTFSYIQLSRLKTWSHFIDEVVPDSETIEEILFYPLLNSDKIQDNAIQTIREAREKVQEKLCATSDLFVNSECQDRIRFSLKREDWSQLEWTQFWLKEIAQSIGMIYEENSILKVVTISKFLRDKETKLIFLFDGLEDVFTRIFDKNIERIALKSLVDIPQRLAELRNPNFGIIVFIRRDYVKIAISQNFGQFESRYSPYGLSWNASSFLKLVYWIFCKANIQDFEESNIDILSNSELNSSLEKVFGKKLGINTSKEPHSTEWIFAALTDFNGTLQARDIVRFLFYVADGTIEKQSDYQVEYWHHSVTQAQSRLLPPRAIRAALEPCSKKKVQEAKEEDRKFREWFEQIENQENVSERKIPFTVGDLNDLNIDRSTLAMLQEIGVLYEDQPKNKAPRYYIPEIFRTGLGFRLDGGSRPRVLVLKRKIIGKNFLA